MHRHTVYFAHNNPLRIDFSEWIFALDDRRIYPKNTIDFSSRKVHTQISAQTNLISFLLFWRQIYFLSRFMLRIFLIYYLMVVSAAMVVVVTVPCWKVENTCDAYANKLNACIHLRFWLGCSTLFTHCRLQNHDSFQTLTKQLHSTQTVSTHQSQFSTSISVTIVI